MSQEHGRQPDEARKEAAAEAAAESVTQSDPQEEAEPKPQPEAESVPVPTRDRPSAGDYPSGVDETAAKLASRDERNMPPSGSEGATKPRIPAVHEQGPGDPSGPTPRDAAPPQDTEPGDND
ncbi:MAG: hypothetical protein GEU28_00960 [Dehalococcoidia bacterium]|nr:hypothetical protein [Dehalococcoidia bacterium]